MPEIADACQPGQFVTLRIDQGYRPLLRRPFSIHRIIRGKEGSRRPKGIEILYEVVGRGTELVCQKGAGQYLDVLGPLGKGFSILDARYSMLVGGGIGVAPLLFLAEQIKLREPHSGIQALIGARRKTEILLQKGFTNLGLSVKIATDDGSAGFKGRVTELLRHILKTQRPEGASVYACGPKLMLAEISRVAREFDLSAQVCLDEYMACGLGVCLGCAVSTKQGQRLVCKHGPVFDAATLNLLSIKKWAIQ